MRKVAELGTHRESAVVGRETGSGAFRLKAVMVRTNRVPSKNSFGAWRFHPGVAQAMKERATAISRTLQRDLPASTRSETFRIAPFS
jgi:hypothetical protein